MIDGKPTRDKDSNLDGKDTCWLVKRIADRESVCSLPKRTAPADKRQTNIGKISDKARLFQFKLLKVSALIC